MKTSNINISSATLSAIRSLLFNNEGVDISPIVNDMATADDNKDLLAINVALVMRGAKPTIDEASRYNKFYNNKGFARWDFVSYSLIRDLVTYKVVEYDYTETGDATKRNREYLNTCSLANWEEMATQLD